MATKKSGSKRPFPAAKATRRTQKAPASSQPGATRPALEELHEWIRVEAYYRFAKRGYTHGNDLGDWLEAEKKIKRSP